MSNSKQVTCPELFTKFEQLGGLLRCSNQNCSYEYLTCIIDNSSNNYINSKLAQYEKMEKAIPKVTHYRDTVYDTNTEKQVYVGFSVNKSL